MIDLVISGGQTGADRAGWRAAKAAGIKTGGFMPRGFLAEDGPHPEFAGMYGAIQTLSRDYPTRTRMNVGSADVTVFFGSKSSGYGATYWACVDQSRPFYWHDGITEGDHAKLVAWLREIAPRALNVAGNRESRSPGIGAWVEVYLAEVFRLIRGN